MARGEDVPREKAAPAQDRYTGRRCAYLTRRTHMTTRLLWNGGRINRMLTMGKSALIALVLGASLFGSGAVWAGGNKVVTITTITFDPFLIQAVNGVVPANWLENSNKAHKMALAITITGINGVFTEHGSQVVRLDEATLVASDSHESEISVAWTTDTTPQVVGELYTVCGTVVWIKDDLIKSALGPESCTDFGPF